MYDRAKCQGVVCMIGRSVKGVVRLTGRSVLLQVLLVC